MKNEIQKEKKKILSTSEYTSEIQERKLNTFYGHINKSDAKYGNIIRIVETITELINKDIILDIRSQDEQEKNPLKLSNVTVKNLPFYKLETQFVHLEKDKNYLLYCSCGIMSRLQALLLHERGFFNVKVYRPSNLA